VQKDNVRKGSLSRRNDRLFVADLAQCERLVVFVNEVNIGQSIARLEQLYGITNLEDFIFLAFIGREFIVSIEEFGC
jgi:hypothetical protein